MSGSDYKSAGVDVEAGDALVDWLKEEENRKSASPHAASVVDGIGGFASLFRLAASNYQKPCLVTCTDGVGTKVLLAAQYRDYSGVGQDLVAMCVNDLICTGGDPLLFLDYYAVGKLDLAAAKEFLKSVRRACDESDCALVGGETAEMPGVYKPGDFDCAGFAVGIVDEEKAWGPRFVRPGDRLIGVSSSGFHSNGYSLLRRVFEKDLDQWKDLLLKPTALYVKLTQSLKRKNVEIHAAAHVTGGGIDNIPRVLPEGWTWKRRDWEWPSHFREVQKRTGLTDEQMLTTLNCGIGFVFIVPETSRAAVLEEIPRFGHQAFDLGEVNP